MTRCSVIGCGARKNKDKKSLTLHRLPSSENKRKKWLEAIGSENLVTHLKETYICCLHFHDNAFNKTLDVVRLRDDALPSRLLLPHVTQDDSITLPENKPDLTPIVKHNTSNLLGAKTAVTNNAPPTLRVTSGGPAGAMKPHVSLTQDNSITLPQKRPDLTSIVEHNTSNLLGVRTAVTNNAPSSVRVTSGGSAGALKKLGLETVTSSTSGLQAFKVVRLRDDALPSRLLLPHVTQDGSITLPENKPDLTPIVKHNTSNLLAVKTAVTNNAPPTLLVTSGGAARALKLGVKTAVTNNAPPTVRITSGGPAGALKLGLGTATMQCNTAPQPISDTSRLLEFMESTQELEKLKEQCVNLRKKVKRLNETVRRQNVRIANFKFIIKNLQ